MLEMCIIFATLTWPDNPADAISEVLNSKIFLGGGGGGGGMPPEPPKRVCFWKHTTRISCAGLMMDIISLVVRHVMIS